MPYRIHDLELSCPLRPIVVGEDEDGVALIVREEEHPVGFIMRAAPPGTVIDEAELASIIVREVSHALLVHRIRREIGAPPSATPAPSLTIAICTKDRPDWVARCLDSLRTMATPPGHVAPEVLVVDNAPSDERTRACVDQRPGTRYVVEPRVGLDFARNRALRDATGELIAFLDDDVVVDRGWYQGLLEAWRANPDAAAFTGLVLPHELRTPAQILFERRGGFRRGFVANRFRGQRRPGHPNFPAGAGIFGAGCNMVFRRQALLELGGFDEALDTGRPLPGGGDLDAFYRVIRAGFALVYEPRLLVFHQHREHREQLRRQYWTWGLGFTAFLHKSYVHDPERRRDVRGVLAWWLRDLTRQLANALLGRHPLPPDMVLAEIAGGLAGLTGTYRRSVKRTQRIREAHA